MPINRRDFVLSALGSAMVAPGLFPMLSARAGGQPSGAADEAGKAYGSGHFGEWIEDEFGLPAYRYTCDQTTDPKAVTKVTPGILGEREHVHQVGNDRVTAIVSNYGHVRVRQDEGGPKFLNDFAPEMGQFGGGIGWLTGGPEMLGTFYAGGGGNFDRVFGMGYVRKRVAGGGFDVDQVILAPFGDDPVLLSQVTITNKSQSAAALRWVEYWGCRNYQFSFRSFIESFSGQASPVAMRRRFDLAPAKRIP